MNRNVGRVGLAVITYNRPRVLKKCLESLGRHGWGGADECLVIIDEQRDDAKYSLALNEINNFHYIGANRGVAAAKNKAISMLMDLGCDHIFLMEDDIAMRQDFVCLRYIDYAARHGIHHLNYALHGDLNRDKKNFYGKVACYPNCVGAFSYFSKESIGKVGLYDEGFFNAYEHVEHTWRIAKAGMTLPFWFFADHPRSKDFFVDIAGVEGSVIRSDSRFIENVEKGKKYWLEKHGEFLPKKPKSIRWRIRFIKLLESMGVGFF